MLALRVAVVLCLWAAVAAAPEGNDERKAFSLGDVLSGEYSASGLNAVWTRPTHLAHTTTKGIEVYHANTKVTQTIVGNILIGPKYRAGQGSWKLSDDYNVLLWSYEVKTGFRHSTEAKYSILDVSTETWLDLHNGEHLQTALLSPLGNSVAYVYNNNIYYLKDLTPDGTPIQITNDGSDFIYNGVPDWVYEEEVLSSGSAMWFSPRGEYLAFGRFDDTNVRKFSYINYGYDLYPEVEELLYPKAGTNNPLVNVVVTRLQDNISENLYANTTDYGEPILQHVAWANEGRVLVVWLNRIQNDVSIVSYTANVEDDQLQWTEEREHQTRESSGWLDVGVPRPKGDKKWAMLYPQPLDGQRFQKVVIFDEGQLINRDTTKSVATAFYGWNEGSSRIFYQAAPEGKPAQRHVYSVSASGTVDIKCLTCDMKQPFNDATCLYASAAFSTDLSYAAFTCSGPGPAVVRLARVVIDGGITWLDDWQDNKALRDKLETRLMPDQETTTVEVTGGIQAQVRLWLPPKMDRSKKYPMLVFVYGGPGSQQVSNAFSVNWGYHLTTWKEIIYASIDGRGSGYQGSKTLYALYRKLGTVEVQDQIGVARVLTEKYEFIDEKRVGIWGWSYGGYATAMALAQDSNNVFKCGASVAPVTAWELYDSIYTERYMDTPNANPDGYKNANVSGRMNNFLTHEFFLLHGNADDNVHYQQAMRLARALQERGVLFSQQSYPDENHSIRSVISHVYTSLGDFFDRCFVPPEKAGATSPAASLLLPLLLALSARLVLG